MKNKTLWILWIALYILTAGLGFLRENAGTFRSLLTCLTIGFFVPPGVLLWRAKRDGNTRDKLMIRNVSLLSLGLTLVLLVANFLSVMGSRGLGTFLHVVLGIVSAPMFCGGAWVLSLFGWACLLTVSRKK